MNFYPFDSNARARWNTQIPNVPPSRKSPIFLDNSSSTWVPWLSSFLHVLSFWIWMPARKTKSVVLLFWNFTTRRSTISSVFQQRPLKRVTKWWNRLSGDYALSERLRPSWVGDLGKTLRQWKLCLSCVVCLGRNSSLQELGCLELGGLETHSHLLFAICVWRSLSLVLQRRCPRRSTN